MLYLDNLQSLEVETGEFLLLRQAMGRREENVDFNALFANPAVWGVVGSVLTGIITYRTASRKDNADITIQREVYVDKQLQSLLENYKTELGELKQEIKVLTEKNQQLVEEVISLKAKIIELEGVTHDPAVKRPTRS